MGFKAVTNRSKSFSKMQVTSLLKGILILQSSCLIHAQNKQSPYSTFIPNMFNTIQATLNNFNRLSYIPRPIGPFPVTSFRPNDGYVHHLVQPVPQQPTFQLTGSTKTRPHVSLPTPLSTRDEIRRQFPPTRSTGEDTVTSIRKRPPPPLSAAPPPSDNRQFHDVRFVQPPSFVPPENTRKEIPLEKFHKPVPADTLFTLDNNRKPPRVVQPPSSGTPIKDNPKYNTNRQTFVVNTKTHNISSRPVLPTRRAPHISNGRRPISNFRPMFTYPLSLPNGNANVPQRTYIHRQPIQNTNTVISPSENFPKNTSREVPDIPLIPSASTSHVVYVKLPDDGVKRPEIVENSKVAPTVLSNSTSQQSESSSQLGPDKDTLNLKLRPSPPPEISAEEDTQNFKPSHPHIKEGTQSYTQKPEDVTQGPSTASTSSDVTEETSQENKVIDKSPEKEPLDTQNVSSPKTKPLVAPIEMNQPYETNPVTNNWMFGDNRVLTGTPEEMLTLKLADAINNFGFQVYHKIRQPKNLFFSPLSLSAALAIILEGTSNMTAVQMMNGLHFSESNIRPDEVKSGFKRLMKSLKSRRQDYQFENANLLLLQNKFFFKSEFSSNVYKHYTPLLGSVDFATNGLNIQRNVNDWVKQKTHGKIAEFLQEPLPPVTVFAVLNAVYFRGRWLHPFDSTLTDLKPFYNYGKDPVDVTMMKQIGTFPAGYSVNLKAQMIELPYEGEETSMVIVLPEEQDGIYRLRQNLSYQELYMILHAMEFRLVQISLPRFSLRSHYSMENVLKEMGMRDVFIPGRANFARMTNVTGLYVSQVSHEGVIDVDEKGTEAAAGTGAVLVPLSRPQEFVVDHPFFFFIRNRNNGAILFIGQFNAFDA